MAAEIERTFPGAQVELIEGGRGDFIVTAGAERLWDKRRMDDRFPDPAEILAKLRAAPA